MPEPVTNAPHVYRRIHPHGWNIRKNEPEDRVFSARPETGLSVFRADLSTPRRVIQHAIDAAQEKAASKDPAIRQTGEKQLAEFGETVEQWLQHGWRIVRLPLQAFTERGYTVEGPDPDGHLNLYGDYISHTEALIQLAELVPEAECLALSED